MTGECNDVVSSFNRSFFQSNEVFTFIGEGSCGGKGSGLIQIEKIIREKISAVEFPSVELSIPKMVILRTQVFDWFMERNNLFTTAVTEEHDEDIIQAFLHAELPVEILGDLRGMIENVHVPLAVRSSSMLEDAKYEPFAGIYATKMISNNQTSIDERFNKLVEAIKFVYASVYFKASKDYFEASSHTIKEEKMAVIIQEVVGQKYNDRFYPNFSGVARSYNFYPSGRAKPEDGVVNLALGLGKTIVDGGVIWSYSPLYPNSVPPFGDPHDIMRNTQNSFWSVNMSHVLEYNPVKETEFMSLANLKDADYDDTLKYIGSTYDAKSDRIVMGCGNDGPRVINFAQLLSMNEFKFNDLMNTILKVSEEAIENPVEIEFAVTIPRGENKLHFGFLQVRPMVVSDEVVDLKTDELYAADVLLASKRVMGNGVVENITDVIFVKPETFDKKDTQKIAYEIDSINKGFVQTKTPYLLIGFGRWGSSDSWLGIPVDWGQIAGAKVIVESTLFGINVELSQGSHFFHNLSSFNVSYFSLNYDGEFAIDWEWLNQQKVVRETNFIKHVKLESPLKIKVDGKTSRGVIKKC
ncbi:MAG: response regulator receiver [Stygiobacter sp.]|nr:MAG: response regulator receiver [Stygiobacter sp.]KAF0215736.1 MAG: response regulator [Ignavibacteria bacterium]